MRILCPSWFAGYACQHSGECCGSGWPIHIEADRLDVLNAALAAGRFPTAGRDPFIVEDDLPPGAGAVLRTTSAGRCAFHDDDLRRCAIHRELGHEQLPIACQHFPRRSVIERDAIFVSLSHYCPTVARMAFDGHLSGGIVVAPATLVGRLRLEGLDARDALPPLLHPGMLTDLEGYRAWERAAVGMLERGDAPEASLARLRAFTDEVSGWRPGDGPMTGAVAAAAGRYSAEGVEPGEGVTFAQRLADRELARLSIPEAHRPAAAAGLLAAADARWVAPEWGRFSRPLGRFLAAHAFGNWCAYFGTGLHAVVRSLEVALAVVRVEAARLCDGRQRVLDREILIDALRAADLLLAHLADPGELARRCS